MPYHTFLLVNVHVGHLQKYFHKILIFEIAVSSQYNGSINNKNIVFKVTDLHSVKGMLTDYYVGPTCILSCFASSITSYYSRDNIKQRVSD